VFKKKSSILICIAVLAISALAVQSAFASGGSMFIMGDGATNADIAGTWYCGYVVAGSPGTHTYTLYVSATHGSNYPLSDVHIVVLISNAAHEGGLSQVVLSSSKTTADTLTTSSPDDFTIGTFDYGASGGPFQLADYYGYNRDYVIPTLTQAEADKNNGPGFPIQAQITFGPTANSDSKVYFLVYGTDDNGNTVKAPFSGGTLFVLPEYAFGGLMGIAACIGAFAVYNVRKNKKTTP
jgi:hypothetical protein